MCCTGRVGVRAQLVRTSPQSVERRLNALRHPPQHDQQRGQNTRVIFVRRQAT